MDYNELTKAFGALFAIMNPFVNLPIFLALTASFTVAQQRTLAVKIVIIAAVMCGVILVLGQQIISFFGITVDQFRIAGGAVLAHIAWTMLNGGNIASHHGTGEEKQQQEDLTSLAFYPITFPIIVGPGTIATLIIYAGNTQGREGLLALAGIVGVILLMLFVVLYFAAFFGKALSDTMRVVMTRLMGMILLAIAVEMIVEGIKAVLPGLA
ncbi:MarC family protein (plasmid) [Falsihalocynthiibacter sp. SS001]|uniref:MarC family protein n=1 Tax=Falsihalocynthiibacter sp. SS001 TaxID=3349698 RepID=UPI0036D2FA53